MTDFSKTDEGIDRYVGEINAYPLLSRHEEQALATRYRDGGDLDAAQQLVVANLRFVVKIAHEYAGYGLRFWTWCKKAILASWWRSKNSILIRDTV